MQQKLPPLLIILCACDSTHPTHTCTETHTYTHVSTVRGCHKRVLLLLLLLLADSREGKTIRLMMLHGGRESKANTNNRKGSGLFKKKNVEFSKHLHGSSSEAERNSLIKKPAQRRWMLKSTVTKLTPINQVYPQVYV